MDVGYRSPLFDSFRQGEVDAEIRILAARGGLGLGTHEQLAVLAWLADDADPDVRATVSTTIARIPASALSTFLAKPDVSPALREFFRQHAPEPAAPPDSIAAESLEDGLVTEVAVEPRAEERPEGAEEGEGDGAEQERGGEPGSQSRWWQTNRPPPLLQRTSTTSCSVPPNGSPRWGSPTGSSWPCWGPARSAPS